MFDKEKKVGILTLGFYHSPKLFELRLHDLSMTLRDVSPFTVFIYKVHSQLLSDSKIYCIINS